MQDELGERPFWTSDLAERLLVQGQGRIGEVGFEIPNIGDLDRLPLRQASSKTNGNIIIKGEINEESGFLYIEKGFSSTRKLEINIWKNTKNAAIIIGKEFDFNMSLSISGDNNSVIISGGIPIVGHSGNLNVQIFNNRNLLFFGRGASTNHTRCIIGGSDKYIIVGDDCMFAQGIVLRVDDQHAIIDMNKGEWLNSQKSILIEPHVWLSEEVLVMKGSRIGFGSIVGAKSLVNSRIDSFALVVGSPAKPVRQNVSWLRPNAPNEMEMKKLRDLSSRYEAFWGNRDA